MDLCVDIGNTRSKAFVFEEERPVEMMSFDSSLIAPFLDWMKDRPPFDRSILCSVKTRNPELIEAIRCQCRLFIELDQQTALPFENMYLSKASLGKDRIALVAGARGLFPGRNVLIVDAGTAITFDLLTEEGKYLGGNIAPGARLRFQSLHDYTDRLPLRSPAEYWPLLGSSTDTALEAGVMQGICFEIQGYISALSDYPDLVVILTGGDALHFDKKINYPIFAYPDLLAEGLYRILEYNARKN